MTEPLGGVTTRVHGAVVMAQSSRASGDFGLTAPGVARRRSLLTGGLPVLFPIQVHGAAVVVDGQASESADAVVTAVPGQAISVITADCVPIVLWTDDGVIGVAHAGWRGLVAGVIEATARAVRSGSNAPHTLQAVLGPCIGPCCYEFGADDLETVRRVHGNSVVSRTAGGSTSLDLGAAVAVALERAGAAFSGHLTPNAQASCTACDMRWFSWRRDRDSSRQTTAVWVNP